MKSGVVDDPSDVALREKSDLKLASFDLRTGWRGELLFQTLQRSLPLNNVLVVPLNVA